METSQTFFLKESSTNIPQGVSGNKWERHICCCIQHQLWRCQLWWAGSLFQKWAVVTLCDMNAQEIKDTLRDFEEAVWKVSFLVVELFLSCIPQDKLASPEELLVAGNSIIHSTTRGVISVLCILPFSPLKVLYKDVLPESADSSCFSLKLLENRKYQHSVNLSV